MGDGIPVDGAKLYIGNSGTTSRSITSYVALGNGTFIIDGDAPMRQSRPMADLLDALGQLGIDARSRFANGCLPIEVQAKGFRGGKTRLDASKSSQFLTSLLLVAPYADNGLEIEMVSEFKTEYIDITMAVMQAFGIEVEHDEYQRFRVAGNQCYTPRVYAIEPDASNASYFFAAAALTGGRVRVADIAADSAQGDIHFVNVLEKMGCTVNRYASGVEVIGAGSTQRYRHRYEGHIRYLADASCDRSLCQESCAAPQHRAHALAGDRPDCRYGRPTASARSGGRRAQRWRYYRAFQTQKQQHRYL